jgi:hypothetical protein
VTEYYAEPIPFNLVMKDVPLNLQAVITKALAKEPSQRWQRVIHMRDALVNVAVL